MTTKTFTRGILGTFDYTNWGQIEKVKLCHYVINTVTLKSSDLQGSPESCIGRVH